jgi:hypothetical protein
VRTQCLNPNCFSSNTASSAYRLNTEIAQRPLFIGIDDDMVSVVEEGMRTSHADRMRATFEAYWPVKAPWEI